MNEPMLRAYLETPCAERYAQLRAGTGGNQSIFAGIKPLRLHLRADRGWEKVGGEQHFTIRSPQSMARRPGWMCAGCPGEHPTISDSTMAARWFDTPVLEHEIRCSAHRDSGFPSPPSAIATGGALGDVAPDGRVTASATGAQYASRQSRASSSGTGRPYDITWC